MTTNGMVVRLEFRSAFDMLDFVQLVSDHLCRRIGLDEDACTGWGVAIRESVINAIRHGNRNDEGEDRARRVRIRRQPRDRASWSISRPRQGEGFDTGEIADPLAPENLLKSSGRGIFLIRNFMDDVSLRRAPEGGMEVRMVKRSPSGSIAASLVPGRTL